MAQALTVPLAPSFVPFGLFCMTAVADLESLMDAVQDNRYRPRRSGVGGMVKEDWGLDAVPWGGETTRGRRTVYIHAASMAPEKQG
jgi:hypothetical protein